MGFCFLKKPELEYLIAKPERVGRRVIFHFKSSNLYSNYQYLLPKHYTDVVSEADHENINNQKYGSL
jgi:hypothetical protein